MSTEEVYTHPALREALKAAIRMGNKGGAAGQWSARKAQFLAREYRPMAGAIAVLGPGTSEA
jgi:hypothetical protein